MSPSDLERMTLLEFEAFLKGYQLRQLDKSEQDLQLALFIRYAMFSKKVEPDKVINKKKAEEQILFGTPVENIDKVTVDKLTDIRSKLSFNNV